MILLSDLGAQGVAISSPVLVLCTRSPELYDELNNEDKWLPAGEALAAVSPEPFGGGACGSSSEGTAGASGGAPLTESQMALQKRYQVRLPSPAVCRMISQLAAGCIIGAMPCLHPMPTKQYMAHGSTRYTEIV